MIVMFVVEYVIPTVALIALGGYLEYRFGARAAAKVAADLAHVTADVAVAHARIDAIKAAAK